MTALQRDDDIDDPNSVRCAGRCGRRLLVNPRALIRRKSRADLFFDDVRMTGRSPVTCAYSEDVADGRRVFFCRPCTEDRYRLAT
jgi:hypothetical protein